jgi:hypothetical protein
VVLIQKNSMASILLILGMLAAAGSPQKPAPSFKGYIRLPVDLYSSEGTHLEAGPYVVEVKMESGRYSLVFLQDDQPRGAVKSEAAPDNESNESGYPLIGTQYLRSSDDPVGTEAQRHFSKTGLPQYQEENRDWKATLRAYTTNDQKQALWIFEQRQPGAKWSHLQFRLYFHPQ